MRNTGQKIKKMKILTNIAQNGSKMVKAAPKSVSEGCPVYVQVIYKVLGILERRFLKYCIFKSASLFSNHFPSRSSGAFRLRFEGVDPF